VVALVAATMVPAPAQAAARCRPSTTFDYQGEAAVYSFSFPTCGRTPEMGSVRVRVSVERCAQTCDTTAAKKVCDPGRRCSLTIRVPHSLVEVADYTGRATYRSTGRKVAAGARTTAASCIAAAATWACL
jgi:hypothetical protein